jgi:dUTP pyrophosphatase
MFSPRPGCEHLLDKGFAPARETATCAGIDFYSPEAVSFKPFERKLIRTGFEVLFPEGIFGQLADCSSIALKKGLHVLGGIIDNDYQGEIFALLINLNPHTVELQQGDKLLQMILQCQILTSPVAVSATLRRNFSVQSFRQSKGYGVSDTSDLLQTTNEAHATATTCPGQRDLRNGTLEPGQRSAALDLTRGSETDPGLRAPNDARGPLSWDPACRTPRQGSD